MAVTHHWICSNNVKPSIQCTYCFSVNSTHIKFLLGQLDYHSANEHELKPILTIKTISIEKRLDTFISLGYFVQFFMVIFANIERNTLYGQIKLHRRIPLELHVECLLCLRRFIRSRYCSLYFLFDSHAHCTCNAESIIVKNKNNVANIKI